MATVIGNRIFSLPEENLAGIGQGLGEILNAIGQQRQQAKDFEQLSNLQRTLAGDTLPAGQAGPVRPPVTDPQTRLQQMLRTGLSLRTPKAIQSIQDLIGGEVASQQLDVQRNTTILGNNRDFTLTRKDGSKQKIKINLLQETQIRENLKEGENLELGTPIDNGTEGATPTTIKEFETITGIDPAKRKTPEYEKSFFAFQEKLKEVTGGRKQLAGLTPEGLGVVFDPVTGTFESKDIGSELLPKNKKLLPGEIASQLGTFDALENQIKDIKILSENNPEFIGPVQGRWNKLKSKFADNQDFTELDRNVESLITIAYALSGKQISEKEMRMLKTAILPSVTQPGANFNTALDFAEKWITTQRDSRIKRLKSSGFFVGDVDDDSKSIVSPQNKTADNKEKDVQAEVNKILGIK